MSSLNVRPRFKKNIRLSPSELEALLKEALGENNTLCSGYVAANYCTIKVPIKDRHFWSPQLTISFEEDEGTTLIRGLYGPNPTVWAVFFFGYVILGILGLFVLVIGFSRMTLDMDTSILWALPALSLFALGLYLVAQAGQKIGAEQMYTLHHFFESLIYDKVNIKII
ncbi:MAG: hypothetical protein AAF519_02625 [Bacteroidota bacterium]